MASEPTVAVSSPTYEPLRRRYFNSRVPNVKPAEIHCPRTTAEVAAIIKSARARNLKVGVRSGGHSFSCLSLVEDGLLIDTSQLNSEISYDSATKVVSFSPGRTVQDLASYMTSLARFFPFGHARKVGTGGFYLAGGQGCFLRGWGYTCDQWVTQIEVVVPSGDVVIASATQNADLYWAAPGSGVGFFGVVTRIWGRTLPAKKLFDTTLVFDVTDVFKPLLKWFFLTADRVPKYGSDLMFVTFYADKDTPDLGDESRAKRIMAAINQTIWADSLGEAEILASLWDAVPEEFQRVLAERVPLAERTWEFIWKVQDSFQPSGKGTRYRVIGAVTPAVYELPTRRATGNICPLGDYYPDEADHCLSLPQKCTVTTITCYQDASRDAAVDQWTAAAYREAEKVAIGQYVADYDPTQRQAKIMSDTALRKWLGIRSKWDPEDMFVGYRAFEKQLSEDVPMPKGV
ncbi:uncharacterized protein A1O9_00877 [Exophiala aquamarina CBS 119918]|uniref:FAD-binding PCMH-type domain-containing protein n=1 Tax=Exophiala aquamarina CBS 119918 TaxID=1182545 RepID=A0A072PU80_9EURO|nr:uncharacterized protein A1O9_00877 [Exophiala aquamarina CBS 119918]KEF62903.1 hypothetical protein A1O9_00877 [Exophiala aquamarina CBS 119918]